MGVLFSVIGSDTIISSIFSIKISRFKDGSGMRIFIIGIFLFGLIQCRSGFSEVIKLKGLGKLEVQAVVLSKTSETALITTQIGDQQARYEFVKNGTELRHGYKVSLLTIDRLELVHESSKGNISFQFPTAPVLQKDLVKDRIELYSQNTPLVYILLLLAENSGDNIIFTDDIGGYYQRDWTTRKPEQYFEKFAKRSGCKAIYKADKKLWLIGPYSRISKIKLSKANSQNLDFTARNISLNFVLKKIGQLMRTQMILGKIPSKKVSMRIKNLDYLDVLKCLGKMYKFNFKGPFIEIKNGK